MVQIDWTSEALAELELIRSYIALFDASAADRLARRLLRTAESLANFPNRGRPAGLYRELVTVQPYALRYRVEGDRVYVIRVRHAARAPDEPA